MTVMRTKHNRENPYVQINKCALWHPTLSLKAIGLWAKCLSRPDNWTFNVEELSKKIKEGRRAIYSAIEELEKERYVLKLKHFEKKDDGKFDKGGIEYIFFEFPYSDEERDDCIEEFKKSFRQCGFGNRRDGDLRNSTLLKTDSSSEEGLKKKEKKKEKGAKAPPPADAVSLSSLLFEAIRKANPKLKIPKGNSWGLSFADLLKDHSIEDIRQIIEWFPNSWWAQNISGVQDFCKHFVKMQTQMLSDFKKAPKRDVRGLELIKNIGGLPYDLLKGKIELGADYVDFGATQGAGIVVSHYYKLGQKDFVSKVLAQLEKMGLLHLFEDWFDKYREE